MKLMEKLLIGLGTIIVITFVGGLLFLAFTGNVPG
jgi:hypothetical protein